MIHILGSGGYIGNSLSSHFTTHKIEHNCIDSHKKLESLNLIDSNEKQTLIWCAGRVNPVTAENSIIANAELENFRSSLAEWNKKTNENSEIIFLSSGGCVYSSQQVNFNEEDEALGINAYGKIKVVQEKMIEDLGRPYKILRISNVYGGMQPHGRGQGVIAEWLYSIFNHIPIRVFGSLNSFRDYLNLTDLNLALEKSIGLDKNGIFNVASGTPTSLGDIIEILKREINLLPQIEILESRNIDRKGYFLDVAKFKNSAGWEPKYNISNGLRKTLDEYSR